MINKVNIFLFLFLFSGITLFAQKKFTSDNGEVSFTSNAKLELINASSKKIKGILDPSTGNFAFVVTIQSFEGFNSNLQREHFNEKYMEADKFYDATFSGKIIESVDFTKDGVYDVRAKGNLVIHGKKQVRIIPGKIQIEKGIVKIDSNFNIPLVDHDIKVPQVITEKIATEIIVKLNVSMTQK
jgi:polyisoprenoid-binding protein YceI